MFNSLFSSTGPSTRSALWPFLLAAAAIAATPATACMMPFVAVATVAAATMRRGEALIAVLGAWGANQLIGFGMMGYPLDAYALGWGAALGGAAVAAMEIARAVLRRRAGLPGIVAAFVAAFAGFEGLLFAFALVAGGTGTFTPAIVAEIALNDGMWLVAFVALHMLLSRAAPNAVRAAAAQ